MVSSQPAMTCHNQEGADRDTGTTYDRLQDDSSVSRLRSVAATAAGYSVQEAWL